MDHQKHKLLSKLVDEHRDEMVSKILSSSARRFVLVDEYGERFEFMEVDKITGLILTIPQNSFRDILNDPNLVWSSTLNFRAFASSQVSVFYGDI